MKIVFLLKMVLGILDTSACAPQLTLLQRRLRDTKTFPLFIAINIYLGVLFS